MSTWEDKWKAWERKADKAYARGESDARTEAEFLTMEELWDCYLMASKARGDYVASNFDSDVYVENRYWFGYMKGIMAARQERRARS